MKGRAGQAGMTGGQARGRQTRHQSYHKCKKKHTKCFRSECMAKRQRIVKTNHQAHTKRSTQLHIARQIARRTDFTATLQAGTMQQGKARNKRAHHSIATAARPSATTDVHYSNAYGGNNICICHASVAHDRWQMTSTSRHTWSRSKQMEAGSRGQGRGGATQGSTDTPRMPHNANKILMQLQLPPDADVRQATETHKPDSHSSLQQRHQGSREAAADHRRQPASGHDSGQSASQAAGTHRQAGEGSREGQQTRDSCLAARARS